MHMVSVALAFAPATLSRFGSSMALSAEDSVFLGTAAFCMSLLFLPNGVNRLDFF